MDQISFARQLRREMTPAERHLWALLRLQFAGFKFRRQAPRGPYFLDFVCLKQHLVIEVDGGQHSGCEADRVRDAWLTAQGFQVLRFWNPEVMQNLEGVELAIEAALNGPSSPLTRTFSPQAA